MSENYYLNMTDLIYLPYQYNKYKSKTFNKTYAIDDNLTFGLIYSKLHVNERKFIHQMINIGRFFYQEVPYNRLIFFPLFRIYYHIYYLNENRENYLISYVFSLKSGILDTIMEKFDNNVPFIKAYYMHLLIRSDKNEYDKNIQS